MSMYEQPGTLETDHVEVRNLRTEDLDWVVRVDSQHSGKQRREYYKVKLAEVGKDTGIKISLAAFVKNEPALRVSGSLGSSTIPLARRSVSTVSRVARRVAGCDAIARESSP